MAIILPENIKKFMDDFYIHKHFRGVVELNVDDLEDYTRKLYQLIVEQTAQQHKISNDI